ncbi:DNA adenine methylase [Ruegeria arenilitoris]|uniref:DNA adenine methylase n=1 Tax=Ruegeria arenilitoris TaxID=1173585 RepID=UPI00147AA9BC|nr:Dam family site-specific DNA-(adenine-N6)-methyltransferase [Ruegeria arenilitoris]
MEADGAGEQKALKPFLKWAGGKRWLLPHLQDLLPKKYETYLEPFLGGGAVFFGLQPKSAVLTDLNGDLIELYQVVRDMPSEVQDKLSKHQLRHSKEYYYEVRAEVPECRIDRAARFLYLNRTCFNGLYRVNRRGEFNVPIGTKTKVLFETESFHDLSSSLSQAELSVADFESTIDRARKGDLLYVDPPYTVAHNFNGFVKYNDNIFSWEDQVRLRDSLDRAAERGAAIIVSNANHTSIDELYADFGTKHEMPRHSVIAGPSGRRVPTSELLFCVGC